LASPDASTWPSVWGDLGGLFQISKVNPVAAPSGGLGSKTNYIFQKFLGKPVKGLRVIIDVTADMIIGADSPANLAGCSFQLNTFSPEFYQVIAQQFIIGLWGKKLEAAIQNWNAADLQGSPLVNLSCDLADVPGQQLNKGLRFTISLQNDPSGRITGALFGVFSGGQQLAMNGLAIDPQYIAPIVGFQLNIVGPANREQATFTSGTGTITYSSVDGQMYANSAAPQWAEEAVATGETSNIVYDPLDSQPDSTFLQLFTTPPKKFP
jgi:hypothetical protein